MGELLLIDSLASLEEIQEKALHDMRQVESPVWRRHLEDLAAACDTVIACVLRLRDDSTDSHADSKLQPDTLDESCYRAG